MSDTKKVFVGVSGGVDSSVALALLKKQNYDVTGVFLKVWSPDFLECDWREERRSAMRVCATLGVPFLTLDCEAEYKKEVVDYMIRGYSEGRVPNPDVFCNKYVKFGVFLKKALEMGADFVATGHYATRYEYTNHANNTNGFELRESKDKEKDQSYFLHTLNQEQLSRSLFPIGGYTKPEVREMARKFGLPTAEKKDSQGLCFIGKIDIKDFLSHYIKTEKGNVLNVQSEIIGEHPGALFFAIGQRHGFTITKKNSDDSRYFVISKSMKENTITVANKEKENVEVYTTKEIFLRSIHFISSKVTEFPLKTEVRIRYRQNKQDCMIQEESGGYRIYFKNPQEGVSIGQSAVFYDGEVCLGGGIIENY
ncbi:MAG: tRNA 2-thiouridine(34) synthase MnmA [Minisyncoccia bacterium]